MIAHYKKMIADTDKRVARTLQIQNTDKSSRFYGGVIEEASGIYQAKSTIYRTTALIAAYLNEESIFFNSEEVFCRIDIALSYIERKQHDNGLFDYITCNFFSAPDTAFCIKKLIPTLELLRTVRDNDDKVKAVSDRIETIVHKGARGLLLGGFHTPNHRWAIASVLAYSAKLFGDEELREAAFIYLNEGIDCNGDGEFAEKSAGNYNRVNNDAMIMLSEGLEDPAYEQNAIRNLRMMLTYFEPDDSIFTANSTRFDKDHLIFPKDYYLEYLKLGIKYSIPEFLDMANYIFEIVAQKNISSPDFLTQYMLYPELRNFEHEGSGYKDNYKVFYKDSKIARVRRGNMTYTIMNGKSNFLYVHNKSIKLEMKIGGSFCEHRAFKSESMTENADGSYSLHQTMRGWYYLPFKDKPATSDWWQMDNASREKKLGPDMNIDVTVREVENGIDVDISTSGVEGAPWRVELAFSGIDKIVSEHVFIPVHGDETIILKDSYFEAMNRQDILTVGPGFGTHDFTEGKEDSEQKNPGAATVYFTDYTSFHHVISIRNGREK